MLSRIMKFAIIFISVIFPRSSWAIENPYYVGLRYEDIVGFRLSQRDVSLGDVFEDFHDCKKNGVTIANCIRYTDVVIWLPKNAKRGDKLSIGGNELEYLGCSRLMLLGERKTFCQVQRSSGSGTGPIRYFYTPREGLVGFLFQYKKSGVELYMLEGKKGLFADM